MSEQLKTVGRVMLGFSILLGGILLLLIFLVIPVLWLFIEIPIAIIITGGSLMGISYWRNSKSEPGTMPKGWKQKGEQPKP